MTIYTCPNTARLTESCRVLAARERGSSGAGEKAYNPSPVSGLRSPLLSVEKALDSYPSSIDTCPIRRKEESHEMLRTEVHDNSKFYIRAF